MLCSSEGVIRGGLLFGLFAAGAAGSIIHCGPMCGVFVLGQVSDRMVQLPAARLCERQRIENAMLVPYHLGRLTTYGSLGALAAVLGRVVWLGRWSGVLLVIAAVLFLAHAFQRALPNWERAPLLWGRAIGGVVRLIPRGSLFGEYLFGVTLGFLPCGLLYAALTAAAASGSAGMGAAGMVAFGLGTVPVLMVVGIAGQAAGRRWQSGVSVAAPVLMVVNAVLLLALAWQRVG